MKLKPKSTVHNKKALIYRRFIGLERSLNLNVIYKTNIDNKFWTFDCENAIFEPIDSTLIPTTSTIKVIPNSNTYLTYQDKYFAYVNTAEVGETPVYEWSQVDFAQNKTLLSATFNNIGKYQTNKYYYVGSFDYMIKGSVEGTTSQFIKGNFIPLTSMNIKYFDDSANLSVDDLVVIDKKVFAVENPETVNKMQPRPYKVYFATLNAIL